jgi:hypothetical protein
MGNMGREKYSVGMCVTVLRVGGACFSFGRKLLASGGCAGREEDIGAGGDGFRHFVGWGGRSQTFRRSD